MPSLYTSQLADKKLSEMCEHMKALIAHCLSVGVLFGGCGDCGSAWLDCKTCKNTVTDAHEAFGEYLP